MKHLHHIKKLHRPVYYLLCAVILVLLPIVVFTLVTSKSPILLGIRSYVVVSGSMEPNLPIGTLVYVNKEKTYNKGDVIAFNRDSIVVTHRIVEVVKQGTGFVYKTKGDANNGTDSQLVNMPMINGKVSFSVPYVGNLIYFLRTVPGFIAFIVIPTILFIIFEFINIKKELEKEIEKRYLRKLENHE